MKKILLFCAALVAGASSFAQLAPIGPVTQNTNTKQLADDVKVKSGKTLTIESGAALNFSAGSTFTLADGEEFHRTLNAKVPRSVYQPLDASLLSGVAFQQQPTDIALAGTGTGALSARWLPHELNAGTTTAQIVAASGVADDSAGGTDIFLDSSTEGFADVIIYAQTSGPTQASMVLFRFSKSTRSGYGARYTGVNGKLEILRWDAGTPTIIGEVGETAPTGLVGYYVTMTGSSIQVVMVSGAGWKNLSATDSTYKSGYCGLRLGNAAGQFTRYWSAAPLRAVTTHAIGGATISAFGLDVDGTTAMQTQNTGDSFAFGFSGPYAALNIACNTGVTGYIGVTIDGLNFRRINISGATGAVISVPIYWNPNSLGRKNCRVVLLGNDSTTDNWNTPTNALRVTAIRTAAGYSLSAPDVSPTRIVVVGDSIPRGRSINEDQWELGNATNSWPWLLAQRRGAEIDFIAFSGQGATNTGAGNVPAAKTALLSYSSGRTRSADSSVSEVFVALGTNDGGVAEATLKADITTVWTRCRTLWPSARITVILPLGYSVNSASPSAIAVRDIYNGYITAAYNVWADSNKRLIDLTDEIYGDAMPGPLNAGINAYTSDAIHPNKITSAMMALDIDNR